MEDMTMNGYEPRKAQLINTLRTYRSAPIGLGKTTSNLFRDRKQTAKTRLDVRNFNHVLHIDKEKMFVEAEGMTPYETLVEATLRHGVLPTVVPQLKTITLGGAAAGVGIESSSFKYGLVHETLLEMEILLADGCTEICTPDNKHSDLFYGFPNSYGTFGYALKLKVRTVPVKPNVQLSHIRHTDAKEYFIDLEQRCRETGDFIDGVVFGPREMYITMGKFVDHAPFISDYTFKNIYYQSIRKKETDYLTTLDYIWRWDTDWFWCSKNLFAQNPVVRRLIGKSRLNSKTYTKIMRWNSKWGFIRKINALLGIHSESAIQDVDVPVERAAEFLGFFQREIGITPIWICPTRAYDKNVQFHLYRMNPDTLYINFGFWDVVRGRTKRPPGYYNRKAENKVSELGGIKSLYSDVYYPPDEFWRIYNKKVYDNLKAKYDPRGRFKNLYDKTVLKY